MFIRLLLLTATLGLAGCFHTDAVLTVHADGSARLVETVAVDGILGMSVPVSLTETGRPTLPGATLAGLETAERIGTFVTVTTWEIPDVRAFRYDLRDAGRVATLLRGAARWARGPEAGPPHASVEIAFAFAPAAAGTPATLRVTVPERTMRAADLTRLPWHLDPDDAALARAFGYEGPMTPEVRAELEAELAAFAPGRLGPADFVASVPFQQAAETYTLGGTASVRFTVAVEGTLQGGGDRLVVADVALADAFPTFDDLAVLADSAAAAHFDAAARATGFDRPGLRVPPPGDLTIRFQP